MVRPKRQRKMDVNYNDNDAAKRLDELSDYKEFVKHVPKKLRNAIMKGKSAKELYEEFSSEAAARAILIAMTEKDPTKALAAIKEVQDRALGKAVEKKETTHRFDELPEEEVDSILNSKLEALKRKQSAGH